MKICAENFITMQLLLNFTILLTLLSASCSSNPNQESIPENSGFNDPNLIAFVDSAKILDPEEDLSSFLAIPKRSSLKMPVMELGLSKIL